MKNLSLSGLAQKALPALSGCSLTYNEQKNLFLTMGYTSAAGNTYYKAIRLSNRLLVYYNIGEGYCRTFLNGITLFAWDGRKACIIAKKEWGGADYRFYNESFAREQSVLMLKDFLASQAKLMGTSMGENQLLAYSRQLISETERKLLV